MCESVRQKLGHTNSKWDLMEIPPCRNNALLHRGFFTRSLVQFSRACLYFFMGSHFVSMVEPVNSLVSEKLWARIKVNRKQNRPNRPAPPFHSIFQPRRAPTRSNQIQFTMPAALFSVTIVRGEVIQNVEGFMSDGIVSPACVTKPRL